CVEVFSGVFGEGLRNENTRIVDQHVDPAKLRYGSVHDLRGRASIADVSIDQRKIRRRCKWICFGDVSRVCDYVASTTGPRPARNPRDHRCSGDRDYEAGAWRLSRPRWIVSNTRCWWRTATLT